MKYGQTLRFKVAIICLIVIICLVGFSSLRTAVLDSLSAIYASLLVNLTNQDRIAAKVPELSINPLLEKAAQMKADDMAARGYFAHNTPEGKTPWQWLDEASYGYARAGENLAVNFEDSEEIHRAWAASPLHWQNILNSKFTEIGIATSTGFYKGREAIFVVQMFGTPAK